MTTTTTVASSSIMITITTNNNNNAKRHGDVVAGKLVVPEVDELLSRNDAELVEICECR